MLSIVRSGQICREHLSFVDVCVRARGARVYVYVCVSVCVCARERAHA